MGHPRTGGRAAGRDPERELRRGRVQPRWPAPGDHGGRRLIRSEESRSRTSPKIVRRRSLAPRRQSAPGEPASRPYLHSLGQMAFSPDNRRLYAIPGQARPGGRIVILDPDDRPAGRRPEGDCSRISTFRLSPDGHRLATGGRRGLIRIWDATTGDLLDVLGGTGRRIGLQPRRQEDRRPPHRKASNAGMWPPAASCSPSPPDG